MDVVFAASVRLGELPPRTKSTAADRRRWFSGGINSMKTPTHAEVAHGAHQIWQDSGCADGRDVENWLEAEHRLATRLVGASAAAPTFGPAPVFNESFRDRAPAEAADAQLQEARAPITPQKSAPKSKPAESGKPIWSQPHSR